jgi:hypothetical protein
MAHPATAEKPESGVKLGDVARGLADREQPATAFVRQVERGFCAAHGCPLPGALSTGGDTRYCWLHFGAGVSENDRITAWLRRRPLVVDALLVTERLSPAQMDALGQRMVGTPFEELAPRVCELKHDGYGRHGEGLTVERDEREHPKLYMQRVRGLVASKLAAAK